MNRRMFTPRKTVGVKAVFESRFDNLKIGRNVKVPRGKKTMMPNLMHLPGADPAGRVIRLPYGHLRQNRIFSLLKGLGLAGGLVFCHGNPLF